VVRATRLCRSRQRRAAGSIAGGRKGINLDCSSLRAKRSNPFFLSLLDKMDCFVALAMTQIRTQIRDLAAPSARGLACSFRPQFRGRRECRTLGASAAACAVVESTRVSHHGHAGNVRHSPRNGFNGFLRTLPGNRAYLPPSSSRSLLLKNLMPASGHQDHTTRQCSGIDAGGYALCGRRRCQRLHLRRQAAQQARARRP
jgi:hypothetical protein